MAYCRVHTTGIGVLVSAQTPDKIIYDSVQTLKGHGSDFVWSFWGTYSGPRGLKFFGDLYFSVLSAKKCIWEKKSQREKSRF